MKDIEKIIALKRIELAACRLLAAIMLAGSAILSVMAFAEYFNQ
jgi:hypothetical protein